MKAITICQPYANLIRDRAKRVENRTWMTRHRGLIYIHAGKSREWLDVEGGVDVATQIPVERMAFGAVVAIAEVLDCLSIHRIQRGEYDTQYPWLRTHEHAHGPWCWVLDKVFAIGPWPYRGAQGLFDIDDDELGSIATSALESDGKSEGA
jgi:activating signal cointegrator 1